MSSDKPIAVFDSGVGGISVLRELINCMPNENFIYFGDSANAPYGSKSHDEIKRLTLSAVKSLVDADAKEVVIACNTATSVAIDEIRAHYPQIPVIGVEPAVKPAVAVCKGGAVIVMATPATLCEKRFTALIESNHADATVIPLPCPKLARLIEDGHIDDDVLHAYLEEIFAPYKNMNISSIVLGCTHYPFVKKQIQSFFGESVKIFDGAEGTAHQAKRKLTELNLLNESANKGKIEFKTSSDVNEFTKLAQILLNLRD